MRGDKISSRGGFTLIEVIVVMLILVFIMAIAFASLQHLFVAARAADRHMLVYTENQRGIMEMKKDIQCSTKNPEDNTRRPRVTYVVEDGVGADELHFAVAVGFSRDDDTTIFSNSSQVTPPYLVCFRWDEERQMLKRLFRTPITFAELTPSFLAEQDRLKSLMDPPQEQTWIPLYSGTSSVISLYCTDFVLNPYNLVDAEGVLQGNITEIELTNSIGEEGEKDYADCKRTILVRPYNWSDAGQP